jgi:hypothetical protein
MIVYHFASLRSIRNQTRIFLNIYKISADDNRRTIKEAIVMNNNSGITHINYHFVFEDKTEAHFPINLRLNNLAFLPQNNKIHAPWTKLEFNQCECCQINQSDTPHCPIAINLEDIITTFKNRRSYERVLLRVETPERVYEKDIPLQHGLGSLLGIIMVTTGCPTMSILRPMVRFHLPFATIEETIYRSVSCYLLGQYFLLKKGQEPDWDLEGLAEAYGDIQKINVGMTDRLRSISEEDANANAVVVLDVFAKALPSSIIDSVKELEYLFQDISEFALEA